MLREHGIEFEYRDYIADSLDAGEIRQVLGLLNLRADQVLRRRDRAYRELSLDGSESEDRLIELMAQRPTLLQRPIALYQGRAVVGRPPERVLELLDSRSDEPVPRSRNEAVIK